MMENTQKYENKLPEEAQTLIQNTEDVPEIPENREASIKIDSDGFIRLGNYLLDKHSWTRQEWLTRHDKFEPPWFCVLIYYKDGKPTVNVREVFEDHSAEEPLVKKSFKEWNDATAWAYEFMKRESSKN